MLRKKEKISKLNSTYDYECPPKYVETLNVSTYVRTEVQLPFLAGSHKIVVKK